MSQEIAQRIRVLAVAGSLREGSYNRLLARLAASLAPEGVKIVQFEGLAAVEPFDEDLEPGGWPTGAAAWGEALQAADAVLVVTPEYNASIPGQIKNAFDWASRSLEEPFRDLVRSPMYGKPVAVVSASTGQFGGVWARDEFIKSLKTQGARAVEEPKMAVPSAHTAFAEDGTLNSAQTTDHLVALLDALATMTRAVVQARAALAKAT